MAVRLPLPDVDSYLLNLDTPNRVDLSAFDQAQQVAQPEQSPLERAQAFEMAAPLSGDNAVSTGSSTSAAPDDYQPPTDVPLPISQPKSSSGGFDPSWVGKNVKDINPDWQPSGFDPSWVGKTVEQIRQERMPKQQQVSPLGPPPIKYGSDLAGQILTAEHNLPGGTGGQAFVHGAQSQALPMAGAIGGGFLGGFAVGAIAGSAVPLVGTLAGGLVGGLIGYWIGEQIQNSAGSQIATQETRDALNEQTAYEQQNFPLQYAAGGLAIQALAFHPSPRAFVDSFKLIGRVSAIPGVSDKLAELALKKNEPALNQLVGMAWGTGQTAIQAKQQIDQGDLQPGLLALNLVGASLLTQPNKWLGQVHPALRSGLQAVRDRANQAQLEGHYEKLDEFGAQLKNDPVGQEAIQKLRDLKGRIDDAVNNGRDSEARQLISEWNRNDAILGERLTAKPQTQPVAPEVAKPAQPEAAPITTQAQRPIEEVARDLGLVPSAHGFADPAGNEFTDEAVRQMETVQGSHPGGVIDPALKTFNDVNRTLREPTATPQQIQEAVAIAQEAAPRLASEAIKVGDTVTYNGEPMEVIGHPDFYRALLRDARGDEYEVSLDEIGTPEQVDATHRAAPPGEYARTAYQRQRQLAKAEPPEPIKEATAGGVSNRIRDLVLAHPAANAAFQALTPYGDVHVVGGAVRNVISGHPVKDLDLTFSGSEQELADALGQVDGASVQKTGDQFPVYRLTIGKDQVEVALHRTENPLNQHAFATGKNIPIREDLGRRDFTANAMAVNIKTGEFVDPFNGLKHAQNRTLSLVNPDSFKGDPLRMLRALRFIGEGYKPTKKLLGSLKENATLLQDLPPERIQGELDKIFSTDKPGKALEAMRESGVLDHIFPEHLKTVGYDQRSTHHNQLLWDHIIGVVNKTAELNADPDVRMAAFLHDISKPDSMELRPNGKASYLGHEDKGAETSQRILRSLKYPNDRIDRIVFLVKNHMFQQPRVLAHPAGFIHDMSKDLMSIPPGKRQAVVDQRINDLFSIREADQSNHPVNKADIKAMRAALETVGQKPLGRPASNITGNDLIEMGLEPGPEFSRILNQINREVAEGDLADVKADLIHRARELSGQSDTLQASRHVPFDADPWPEVRRAILEHGGIGASPDWPRDYIPADLYREKGKPPDIIAAQVTIGNSDTPPWGEGGSDSDMMKYVRQAWDQHKKLQAQGGYQPEEAPVTRAPGVRQPNEEVRSLARYYAGTTGLPEVKETAPVRVDPERAARLAKWYESAKSDPTNPEVQAAYKAFNEETKAQYDLAIEAGYKFEPWTGEGQPYKTSAEMRSDVLNNKHLYYFTTSEGQPPHELMTPKQNDTFRAIHDLFGHAMNGNEFGPNGEENAWVEHAKMYSPLAQKAMTTETRAQNSTVNYGEHGAANRADPSKTIYPEQKAVIPPREFLPREKMALTHYSGKAREEINPEYQGESGLSSEINRIGPNANKGSRFASYYEQGTQPERFFGEGTSFPVKHTVTGDYRILDLNSPEAARIQRDTIAKNEYQAENKHELDDAYRAAGFDGYKNRGVVRLFGKQPVSHINDVAVTPGETEFTAVLGRGQGEQNGLQQETTGQPATTGEAGVPGEASQVNEALIPSQVGNEGTSGEAQLPGANGLTPTEGTTTLNVSRGVERGLGSAEAGAVYAPPIRAGDIRPNAGDAARSGTASDAGANATDARRNAANGTTVTRTPDYSPFTRAARDSQAAKLGTTVSDEAAQGGTSGWASSSDVADFIPKVVDAARKNRVSEELIQQIPQMLRGGIRLTREEHGTLLEFSRKPNDETKAGNVPSDRPNLYIPDDPQLAPGAHMANAADWKSLVASNKLVDEIRLHPNGNPGLEYLPTGVIDDATRVALILKGWDQRGFYDDARVFPDSLNFENSSPGAKERWRAAQVYFGNRNSVYVNARSVIAFHSMLESGVFKNVNTGEIFDPKIFKRMVDSGLLHHFTRTGDSIDGLVRAAHAMFPESIKLSDYGGAMNGEARAPVDMWRARLAFGKNNTPTVKMYEYEVGRNNFLTRMFSAFDPNILPSHIQSAEWFGYQQRVSEQLAAIKNAAEATGDQRLIRMAKGMRGNLESKNLADVFRDVYGLTQGAEPPILEWHKILAEHRDVLVGIAEQLYTRRYLKGKVGATTRVGGKKDTIDIAQREVGKGDIQRNLNVIAPAAKVALGKFYKRVFIDAKTLRGGPGRAFQSLDRSLGPVAEVIARHAYALEHPADMAKLGEQARVLAGLTDITPGERETQTTRNREKFLNFTGGLVEDPAHPWGTVYVHELAQPLAELHEAFKLPPGLVGLDIIHDPQVAVFADYSAGKPNVIRVNARYFDKLNYVRDQVATFLKRDLELPDIKSLKGYALQKVQRVVNGFANATEETVGRYLLAHELGHAIQSRIFGRHVFRFGEELTDAMALEGAHSMLEHMTEKYMIGLVREGLGAELETLLLAHSSSINEYLGGIKGAKAKGTMPVWQAIQNLLEHQTHQWAQYKKVPLADYSWATPEVYRRNVYEPEVAEANFKELGKIYEKALGSISDSLAVEAESQLSGRGPNPAIDSSLPSAEETSAGVTAYARLPEGNDFQSGTSGWLDASTADQEVTKALTLGERMLNIKASADTLRDDLAHRTVLDDAGRIRLAQDHEVLAQLDARIASLKRVMEPGTTLAAARIDPSDIPWLQRATSQAVQRVKRLPNEGDAGFAQRLVRASGAYESLDHAVRVAMMDREKMFTPVMNGDKVGFKIDGKFYAGSPSDHIPNWDKGYASAIDAVRDNLPDHALSGEPVIQSPIPFGDMEQLRMAFADEFKRPVPSARYGATTITNKVGVPQRIPSMKASDWRMRGQLHPTSELIAKGGGSSNAANMVKGNFDHVQDNFDFVDALAEQGVFAAEPTEPGFAQVNESAPDIIAANEGLEASGGGLPPEKPPLNAGGGGNGEEPPIGGGGRPPKGMTKEQRKEAKRKAEIARGQLVLRNYLSALKDALLIEDPAHRSVVAGVNDLLAHALKTFDTRDFYKDSRQYVKDASGGMKAFAVRYDRVAKSLEERIQQLEAISPGANDRIRRAIHAKDQGVRQGLLDGYTDEEKYLANQLHNYWVVMGDVLKRAGVIRVALQNYFPLMVEKTPEGTSAFVSSFGRQGREHYVGGVANEGRVGFRLTPKTEHAITRLKDEDGGLLFDSPEALQSWADEQELGWKVKTNVADVFRAQGNSVTQALTMKHTVDWLQHNFQAQIAPGEYAPPVLSEKEMRDNKIASLHRTDYVRTSDIKGLWRNALYSRRGDGGNDDLYIHKPLAEMFQRENSFSQLEDNFINNTARTISTMNSAFKQYKFFFTPVHGYSMLGNIVSHVGFNPLSVWGTIKRGQEIVRGADGRRYGELMEAGGTEEGDLTGPAALLQKVPGAGKFFEHYHNIIWKNINYEGTFGLADKLSNEYLAAQAQKGTVIDASVRKDADKFGMAKAKEALGNLESLDMSKSWNLWGNVAFLANRWTTSQMRTLGEAMSIGPLKTIMHPLSHAGGLVPLEGHNPAATAAMRDMSIRMSQRLVFGGMLRFAIVSTVLSTALSALFNNGVASTPFQNFQRDPGRTFDIYTGRDPVTNRDTWIHTPFFLFQREMIDWAMAAVKANNEGKDFVDTNNLGDSVIAAPFERFFSKFDPVTRMGLEVATGTELGQWMAGYSNTEIDSDPTIKNLNKSLQMLGFPNGGSLENRLLYAWRSLFPGFGFPGDMKTATADPGAVAAALGLSVQNLGWQAIGTRVESHGTQFIPGPDGTEVPMSEVVRHSNDQYEAGQQILEIAKTLGEGTPEQERQKFEQMETLRQHAGLSPGQITDVLLHGASQKRGEEGLLAFNAAEGARVRTPQKLGGYELTPEQESAYESVQFQKEALAMEQAMSDPNWKTMDYGQHQSSLAQLKSFADRITRQQFEVALGITKGPSLSTATTNGMLSEFGIIKKQTQGALLQSDDYTGADPTDQQIMMADRASASENAVWEKYYGNATSTMKGASSQQLTSYVALQGQMRDEARTLIEKLPSYTQSNSPMAQTQMLKLSLKFADDLVNQAIQGKAPRAWESPLNQTQLKIALRNGVVLQDAALKQLHTSFIYQEAPEDAQVALDQKYVNLAHNVALYDTRIGIQPGVSGDNTNFNSVLATTLAADEGYQALVEEYFGIGGRIVFKQRQDELADLKARFRQENAIPPNQLAHYDALINTWYKQQNPDYAGFLKARTWWEKYDRIGQAYRASIQSNFGFEETNPLALSTTG